MADMLNYWFSFLLAAIPAGMPLLLGTLGEILTEKSGNLNLGVEGMMYMGAVCGFAAGFYTDSVILAMLAAFAGGALGALIYAFLTVTLKADQNVTGLTLTIFGTGFANFLGENIQTFNGGTAVFSDGLKASFDNIRIPVLADIPVLGDIFFNTNIFVWIGIIAAVAMGWYFHHTRRGLNLRAVGENPAAADAAGINVTGYKYFHLLLGGGICGLGGAYVTFITCKGVWVQNCINGLGWIAVALVIFASWSPYRALLGSLVFGALSVLQFYKPTFLRGVLAPVFSMLPFLVTAIVLVVSSIRMSKEKVQPKGCGINYDREER